MSGYVLDASAAIAMMLLDERTKADEEMLARILEEGASVTALWHLEVANVLLMAERRKRLSADDRRGALAELAKMPIAVDAATVRQAWRETVWLAEVHALTVYDASYLELAIRLKLPLVTRDQDLIRAASALDVGLC